MDEYYCLLHECFFRCEKNTPEDCIECIRYKFTTIKKELAACRAEVGRLREALERISNETCPEQFGIGDGPCCVAHDAEQALKGKDGSLPSIEPADEATKRQWGEVAKKAATANIQEKSWDRPPGFDLDDNEEYRIVFPKD